MFNVLLLNAYSANHAERLRRLLSTQWQVATLEATEGEGPFAKALLVADAVITTRYGLNMPQAPRLKLIQSPVAGHDRVFAEAIPPGCTFCNVHEHEIAVSEYVMLAMLEWNVRMARLDASFRAGDWTGGVAVAGHTHGELAGKTLGLIGLGRIGRAVARRAKAFDMQVVAVTRTPRSNMDHVDHQGSMQELDTMLPRCDFLVVTCPLSEETRGMIDARRLALCRPHLVIINVARAAILDEEALYIALRDRIVAGAVLDVWYTYPTPAEPSARPSRFPFRELANVIMTTHCSAWTDGLIERRWRFIASNLDRLARGEPLQNIVFAARSPAQAEMPT
ncbi:MAG: phosphoglycerate dehydrogenase [Hyphomicrobiales bacterium]|nr:phosphoglycerate dehydrogenase [Hyphomicrobiales bacterium]